MMPMSRGANILVATSVISPFQASPVQSLKMKSKRKQVKLSVKLFLQQRPRPENDAI